MKARRSLEKRKQQFAFADDFHHHHWQLIFGRYRIFRCEYMQTDNQITPKHVEFQIFCERQVTRIFFYVETFAAAFTVAFT